MFSLLFLVLTVDRIQGVVPLLMEFNMQWYFDARVLNYILGTKSIDKEVTPVCLLVTCHQIVVAAD